MMKGYQPRRTEVVRMKRTSVVSIALLALALGLVVGAALQRRGKASNSAAAATSKFERQYAMNVAISSLPFWNEPKSTWDRIGRTTPGVSTEFGGPDSSDPSKQIEQVEALLSTNINGMVLFSTDPNALVPTINKAVDNGLSVVTVFADVPKSKRLAYVGANQVESAKAVAKQAMQEFPGRVKPNFKVLIVVGKIGAEDQDDRRKGFEAAIGKAMQLVTPVVDDYKPDKSAEVIRAALVRDPGIQFIFGCNSQSAIGAISALKELGKKPGDIIVTGWDSETVVIEEIKASHGGVGWVYATSVLYSSYMVETAFALLEADHFGYLYPPVSRESTARAKIPGAPRTIEIPMRIVTAKNVDEFLSGQVDSNQKKDSSK
jgi:ABC-type sugar transport system substrate-binding protein